MDLGSVSKSWQSAWRQLDFFVPSQKHRGPWPGCRAQRAHWAGRTLPTPLAARQGEVDEGPFLGHLTTGLLANTGRRDTTGPTATPGSKLNQEDSVCSPVGVRRKQCLRPSLALGKHRQWPSCSWRRLARDQRLWGCRLLSRTPQATPHRPLRQAGQGRGDTGDQMASEQGPGSTFLRVLALTPSHLHMLEAGTKGPGVRPNHQAAWKSKTHGRSLKTQSSPQLRRARPPRTAHAKLQDVAAAAL